MSDTEKILELLNEQNRRLMRIETAMLGDQQMKRNGIVDDLHDVLCFIEKEKINAAKRKGWLLGAAAAVGGGGAAAVEWLKKVVF